MMGTFVGEGRGSNWDGTRGASGMLALFSFLALVVVTQKLTVRIHCTVYFWFGCFSMCICSLQ